MEKHSQVMSIVEEEEHLCAHRCSHFGRFEKVPLFKPPLQSASIGSELVTNDGVSVSHQYVFILMHLKVQAASATKNRLNINIPEICVFRNHLPYEILYEEHGHIKGKRDAGPIQLRTVYSTFLKKAKERKTQNEEQYLACLKP